MSGADAIVVRVNRLKAEQAHWESVRQQARAELLEHADREADVAAAAAEQEQLRAIMEQALAQLQEVAKELAQVSELLKVEALRKEEQQKAELLHKEQSDKELFEKNEAQRLEALAKDEQQKQDAIAKAEQDKQAAIAKEEQDKQEALAQAERDKPPPPQQSPLEYLAAIDAEWQYVLDEIANEWDYVDKEIEKEMEYNVAQALEAVAEATFQVVLAFVDPVNQKEGKQFLESAREELANFTADEVFQGAPAEHKEMWLKEKFKGQIRAEGEQFGDRKDDLGVRELVQDGLRELHATLLEAVQRERERETDVNAWVKAHDEAYGKTKERLENAGYAPAVLEEKLQQLDAVAKKQEQDFRDNAEKERQRDWERTQIELRAIEAETRAQAERQDAEKRKELEAKVLEPYRE